MRACVRACVGVCVWVGGCRALMLNRLKPHVNPKPEALNPKP